MDKKLILCDFDGTLSPKDMGYQVLKHFALNDGWESISKDYEAGLVGSQEAYKKAAALFSVTEDEMVRYVETRGSLDPSFFEFYGLCSEQGFDFKIVSDGLDFYIETILKKYALDKIEYFANNVRFNADGTISIEFPHRNPECNRCANCKRSIVNNFRETYDEIIYIGDGYSDVCPAQDADLVFAKDILRKNLLERGKECILYDSFSDIHKYFIDVGVHGLS